VAAAGETVGWGGFVISVRPSGSSACVAGGGVGVGARPLRRLVPTVVAVWSVAAVLFEVVLAGVVGLTALLVVRVGPPAAPLVVVGGAADRGGIPACGVEAVSAG